MPNSKYFTERIIIKTITPIFIGQNQANDLSPYSDFVQKGNEIIYIDERKFEDALFSKEGLIDKYVNSVRQKIDKSRTQSNFNLGSFIENNFGEIENFAKIKLPVDQDIKHQTIKRFINTSRRPFIPGSTIKGAIRTAIIYNWLTTNNNGMILLNELINEISRLHQRIKELERKKKENGLNDNEEKELKSLKSKREIEKKLSLIYDEQKLFGRMSKDNKDGFDSRHIQISDTETFNLSDLSILKLHRIKLRDASEVSPFPCETLNPNIHSFFTLKVSKYFKQPDLLIFNSIDLKNLYKIINDFSNASIDYELNSFEKTKYPETINFYEQLKNNIKNSANNYAILRLGAGKTFFDNSIGLAIFNQNEEVFKKYRELLELGKNPISKKLVTGNFPTTRTLVESTKLPIGWVALASDLTSIESLKLYEAKVVAKSIDALGNNGLAQTSDIKKNYIIAEIIDDKSKPPKVKILEGEYEGKVTILPGIRLEGLNLTKGSKAYVKLIFDRKRIQKAEYKGKVDN